MGEFPYYKTPFHCAHHLMLDYKMLTAAENKGYVTLYTFLVEGIKLPQLYPEASPALSSWLLPYLSTYNRGNNTSRNHILWLHQL